MFETQASESITEQHTQHLSVWEVGGCLLCASPYLGAWLPLPTVAAISLTLVACENASDPPFPCSRTSCSATFVNNWVNVDVSELLPRLALKLTHVQ